MMTELNYSFISFIIPSFIPLANLIDGKTSLLRAHPRRLTPTISCLGNHKEAILVRSTEAI